MIICPRCKSRKIFKLKIDNDWGSGVGDYSPQNVYGLNKTEIKKIYSKEELNYDSYDRPDIELYHCRECDKFFDGEDAIQE